MTQTTKRFVFALLTAMLMLSACTPASTPTPQQPPQQVIDNTADQIGTAVALTVAAQSTETALAQPTVTDTPTPTETIVVPPTPILPTATPFVVVPPSSGGGSGSGGSGGSTKVPQLDCSVVGEKPFDGAEFKPGDNFNKVWVIKNTGRKTWLASYGWHYFSSTDAVLTTSPDTTLGKEVKPGDTIQLRVGVVVPPIDRKDSGKIMVTTWAIIGDGSKFCKPYVAIKIIYPGTNP